MHKRKLIGVATMQETKDVYGGRVENAVIDQVFYGVLEISGVNVIAGVQGESQRFTNWIKAFQAIDFEGKFFIIEGKKYKVTHAVQNRRRWYYQIEGAK